ncbi:hypothetical protein [Pseudoxanthomonas suwonensis]|uniref:hypothetical protein n=1 Tax=Pseudoxanthomonas suwonensis TaxID=314722 RepID=UPI000ACFF252|nr:hypothetical protein [Pseudoxanthomonas suwonensis]
MTALSIRSLAPLVVSQGLQGQANVHGVDSARALLASVVARECHRKHYNEFGLLGAASGPIAPTEYGYFLTTDLGGIEVREFKATPKVAFRIIVQFVGLEIVETNETYDEPYMVMSVVTLAPEFGDDENADKLVASQFIKVPGEDHKRGYVFADTRTVWKNGMLIGGTGIKVAIFAYEEDSGDPDKVAKEIEGYLREKAKQISQAIGNALDAGTESAGILGSPEFQLFIEVLSFGIASLVEDDAVGYSSCEINVSDLKKLAALSQEEFVAKLKTGPKGIKYNYTLDVKGDGAYRIYFRVSAAEVPYQDPPIPVTP